MNLFDDIINRRAQKKALAAFTAALDALGYPYELLNGSMGEAELMDYYEGAVRACKAEGRFPVIAVNEPALFELIAQSRGAGFDIAAALAAKKPDGESVFASRLKQCELPEEELEEGAEPGLSDFVSECFTALNAFSLPYTEFSKSFRTCALIRLPTTKPHEAAIYLPFGNWNDCPAPLEMAAMLKSWGEKYGAIPAVLAGDALEVLLPAPLDESALREAAGELIAFSGAAHPPLDEGSTAFSDFCSSLEGKRVWHFWWD